MRISIRKRNIENNRKQTKLIAILIVLIAFLCVIYIYININNKKSYATSVNTFKKEITDNTVDTSKTKISSKESINVNEIINKNLQNKIREEVETQEIEIEYLTEYTENPQLPNNVTQVIQEGRCGKEKITIKRNYVNDELIEEKEVSREINEAAINKIIEVGTAKYKSNYKAKIGDIVYVTSDRLSVTVENNSDSRKIATLIKNSKLQIIELDNEWYKIECGNIIGWVKRECTTNISPTSNYEEIEEGQSKSQLLAQLNFNMNLYKPSGLSLDQFKTILSDSQDKNKVFENNAEYFYYIEKQYNINGVFVAALGIHESAWGTSTISKNKNNLFGYGAYDSSPYNSAYSFSSHSESIDLIARVLVKYYLNPAGTKIYGNETATGQFYNGNTLTGVNQKYATDKNWANAVFNHMKYLYNKL